LSKATSLESLLYNAHLLVSHYLSSIAGVLKPVKQGLQRHQETGRPIFCGSLHALMQKEFNFIRGILAHQLSGIGGLAVSVFTRTLHSGTDFDDRDVKGAAPASWKILCIQLSPSQVTVEVFPFYCSGQSDHNIIPQSVRSGSFKYHFVTS
jgi:hypothetical protein